MIPNIGELAVHISKWDISQKKKNKWKQARYEAMDYYKGNTKEYVSKYFSSSTLSKVVTGNVNVCKRVIDRISLVYMTPPKRIYTNEDTPNLFLNKDLKVIHPHLLELVIQFALPAFNKRYHYLYPPPAA